MSMLIIPRILLSCLQLRRNTVQDSAYMYSNVSFSFQYPASLGFYSNAK
jgi:hypothetical protein